MRYFFRTSETPDALLAGFQLQYGGGSTHGNIGESSEWEGTFSYIAFVIETAYRWRFDKFLVSVGVLGGGANTFKDEWYYLHTPGDVKDVSGEITVFGMFELLFGFEF
ncbi:MAG TPA: hypothetical protein ENN43_07090 [bacterium]|nr:hypothetical protein [bacterium]